MVRSRTNTVIRAAGIPLRRVKKRKIGCRSVRPRWIWVKNAAAGGAGHVHGSVYAHSQASVEFVSAAAVVGGERQPLKVRVELGNHEVPRTAERVNLRAGERFAAV